jgi:nitric oxide synthase-interacting protein
MTRHSKHNTTSGSFTYAERQKLSYGTQSARCTKETLRPLTHCHLCLEMAREPNSCPQGHLSCRSCVLEDILAQKNSCKERKAEYEKEIREREEKRREEEEVKRLNNLKEFLDQQGSAGKLKRPHDLALTLVPPTDPDTNNKPKSPPKLEICCKSGSKGPHPLSLKLLIPVRFKLLEKDQPGCPVCLKLFNSSTALKGCLFKKCGHVVCEPCHKNLKSKRCLVCEAAEEEGVDGGDVILLEYEGTGFAAGGGIVETRRYDLAFQ